MNAEAASNIVAIAAAAGVFTVAIVALVILAWVIAKTDDK